MAISPEQRDEILEVVVGLFNGSPDGNVLTELSNLVEDGTSIEDLADLLAAHSLFTGTILAGKVTVDQQVDVLMDHFGLVADDDPDSAGSIAQSYFTSQIEAGTGFGEIVFTAVNFLSDLPEEFADTFADAAALLANKVQVAKLYAENNPSDDVSEMLSVLAGVSASSPVTEAEAIDYLNSIGQGPNPGNEFNLTFGADTFTGGAGDDTFTAAPVNDGAGTLQDSLDNVDSLDGGAGRDTLNATIQGGGPLSPTLRNIEVVNVRAVANTTTDFANATGVQQIWNNGSSAGTTLTLTTAPIAATFGIRNTTSTTAIDVTDDVTGDADTLSLSVAGAGDVATPTAAEVTSADAAAIEVMNIAAAGDNLIDVATFTGLTSLSVTGSGSLEADVSGATVLETVDAAGNSGGVTLDLSAVTVDLTVTGGSGNDDITAGTGDDTIDVGAGDDRVAVASAQLDDLDTLTGGDGEDTLALLAADDVAVLDATVHTGFETLELGAAAGAVTFDNDGFGFTKVVLAADLTQDLTLDNLGDGTLEVQDNQTGAIAVGSTGDSDALGLVINADAATTLADLDVTDVETVNVSTTAETDDTTFTTIETDGVTALTFAGAGDVIISAITDGDNTNDADTKIASVDLSAQTGAFEMAALGYGTTFTLGNAGDSEFTLAAGETDTFVFTTAFDNEVLINGGEFGGDIGDDKLDLSALGLTDINDLTFTDTGADVEITSDAFEGTIVLAGVPNVTDINASDFIF
ncbi:MAG: hypothetical protein DYH15_12735 [Nitrosomonas sp. PRO4]|nr:hypothetical protein [Nitrosomonas sp. PRO4]